MRPKQLLLNRPRPPTSKLNDRRSLVPLHGPAPRAGAARTPNLHDPTGRRAAPDSTPSNPTENTDKNGP